MSNDDDMQLPPAVEAMLGDAEMWAPVSEDAQESIVAAVLSEVTAGAVDSEADVADGADVADNVTSLSAARDAAATERSQPSRWSGFALGAAAALLLIAGIVGVSRLGGSGADLEVELAGTDLAPTASAVAEVTATVDGTRIVLQVEDLAPAPEGMYYEAWLRQDAAVGVSAGTFHLRGGGDTEIELWAGVAPDNYPLLTVTLQEEAQPESSGQVVLKTRLDGE